MVSLNSQGRVCLWAEGCGNCSTMSANWLKTWLYGHDQRDEENAGFGRKGAAVELEVSTATRARSQRMPRTHGTH